MKMKVLTKSLTFYTLLLNICHFLIGKQDDAYIRIKGKNFIQYYIQNVFQYTLIHLLN